ncbi:hypothetical protein DFQ01_11193 [Paenibacillus cellulosilyticus]|uniref:DUF5667 domain-containing protein n=1 Tax=Paenibacillus cellulosilyticus TaxID=375489 RepID=A0A2V2Z133_9BACL|nr:hypothetical protein [Paenibacillus cellulosilyticus]PWW00946.1 hypothetical protein DFQ01_11193 [Paenibacillus cellulosilyticus]QKS47594.1 hypothetical protein HUB94_24800 [Paenibacillus cellulosilyticus]
MKPTRKLNKVMLNGVLSCVLAMGIGTTTAYADGNDASGITPTPATTDNVAVQTVSDNEQTLTWTANAPEGLIKALISLAEKIKIVITVDGTERAKLLDSLTQDKIEEANDQLEAGETDLAANTLNNAIGDQSLAILLTALITPKTDDEADKADKADIADKSDKADSVDKDEAKKKEVIAKQIRHNIEKLMQAMNKVHNANAKAETEQKLVDRLDELSQKLDALEASIDQQSPVQVAVTQSTATVKPEAKPAQTKLEANNDKDDEDEDDDADENDNDNDNENDNKQEAHKKQMERLKAEHEKQKAILKAERQQLKADKKAAQAEWKANKKQQGQNNQGNNDDDDDHEEDHDE